MVHMAKARDRDRDRNCHLWDTVEISVPMMWLHLAEGLVGDTGQKE